MLSLRVRYLGPTVTKGSRFKVSDNFGIELPVTFPYDYSARDAEASAALEYAQGIMPGHDYRAQDVTYAGETREDTLYIVR